MAPGRTCLASVFLICVDFQAKTGLGGIRGCGVWDFLVALRTQGFAAYSSRPYQFFPFNARGLPFKIYLFFRQ